MTFAAIGLFLANVWGFIYAHWRIVLIAVIVFLALLTGFCVYRGIKSRATIDQTKIDALNKKNEVERKQELREIIDQNADVIKTIDERNALSDLTIEQRSAEAEKKVEEANKYIEDAKRVGRDVTQDELVCLLQPETCK
jgi:hypothetical protein